MKYIIAIFVLVFLSACEKTLDDAVIPYVEQLVVFADVKPGEYDLELNISKTLPVLGVLKPEDAIISDVTGYITDGNKRWNIEYNTKYKYIIKNFEGEAGKTYQLFLDWRGKHIESKTTIPAGDEISVSNYYMIFNEDDWNLEDESWGEFTLMGHFKGSSEYVYLLSAETSYGEYYTRHFMIPNGNTVSRIDWFWGEINEIKNRNYTYKIEITDKVYYDYLENSRGNYDDFDFFSIGGLNIDWNVKGDGIGMFVGKNIKRETVDLGSVKVVTN